MNGYLLRTLIPVLGSFTASVLIGPSIIKMLRKLKAGQTEREEGLESHQKKTGTPTMGGIIFLIPFLVVGLFYGAFHKEVIPVLILSPAYCVTLPTIAGPILPPRSPAIASSANIAVPPVGNFWDDMLIVPGHIIPTENPHNTHPISPMTGFDESDASR